METPALETVEVLEKKCGEEIKGQLFRVDDKRLALRFDLTVPLARVASSNTFRKPFKRYCIAPVWRREEPQKGRFREFMQADADIIGCSSVRAEAELVACAVTALSELGFSGSRVRLNDRRRSSYHNRLDRFGRHNDRLGHNRRRNDDITTGAGPVVIIVVIIIWDASDHNSRISRRERLDKGADSQGCDCEIKPKPAMAVPPSAAVVVSPAMPASPRKRLRRTQYQNQAKHRNHPIF